MPWAFISVIPRGAAVLSLGVFSLAPLSDHPGANVVGGGALVFCAVAAPLFFYLLFMFLGVLWGVVPPRGCPFFGRFGLR